MTDTLLEAARYDIVCDMLQHKIFCDRLNEWQWHRYLKSLSAKQGRD